MIYLVGLKDDYQSDGHVITAASHMPNHGEITSELAHVKELLKRASKVSGN